MFKRKNRFILTEIIVLFLLFFAVSKNIQAQCNAGTASPIFTASNQTTHSVPGTNPIDLSTITVTNTPTAASLKWYSNPALSQEITASTVNAGVYYAAFYDATNNCKSPLAQLEVLLDSDGDGVLDSADLDKDNDGILDAVEGCFITGKYPLIALPNGQNENTWQTITSNHALHKKNMNNGASTIDDATKGLNGVVNAEGLTGVSANYNIKRGGKHKGYRSSYYSRTDNNKILIRANPDKYDPSTGIPSFTGNDVMNYEIDISNVTAGYNTQVTIGQAVNITKNSTGEAGSWQFIWDGGGEATYYDEVEPNANMYPQGVPANFDINNRQIEGLETKGTFVSGQSITTYTLFNRESKWRVVLPIGANNIKVIKTIFNASTSSVAVLSEDPAYGIDNAYPMYGYTGASGESFMESMYYDINFVADFDNDGIPNCLDLDSDNDGCLDAVEGDGNITGVNLANASGTVSVGKGSSANNSNLGTTVNSSGVPIVSGTVFTQGLGESQIVNTPALTIYPPKDTSVCMGENATFSATAITTTATATINYQWLVSADNGITWTNATAAANSGTATSGTTFNFVVPTTTAATKNGYIYKVEFSGDVCGISAPATLIINTTDTDGDGVADQCDLDSDNDGILDTDECNDTPKGISWAGTSTTQTPFGSTHIGTLNATAFVNYNTSNATGAGVTRMALVGFAGNSGLASTASGGHFLHVSDQPSSTHSFEFSQPTTRPLYFLITGLDKYSKLTFTNGKIVKVHNADGLWLSVLTPYYNYPAGSPLNLIGATVEIPIGTTSFSFTRNNTYGTAGDAYLFAISTTPCKDTDGDGILDYLDLDSDNDGCPDALEGGAGFTWDNIVDAQGQLLGGNGVNPVQTPTSGTYNKAVLRNLGNTVGDTETTMGVPRVAGTGQTVGTSKYSNQKAQICIVCTAKPLTTGTDLDTPIGISTLGHNTENWVIDKNAFIKLESKTLGFIPTKMTTAERDALLGVKGMLIWNTTTKCLEIYNGTAWKCAEKGCDKL